MSDTAIRQVDAISIAICRHLGVDEKYVYSVDYHHEVGDVPTVTVGTFLLNDEGETFVVNDEIARETVRYEWRPVEWEPTVIEKHGRDYCEVTLS